VNARVLIIDNYDSFVGNLYQYLGELGATPFLRRHDAITATEAETLEFSHLLISPGPKTPREAGVSVALIQAFAGRVPILGVCLGHQAIGHAFGGKVVRAGRLVHGKTSEIHHDRTGLFAGLPTPIRATRYHSLALERMSLPESIEVTAEAEDGEIMAIRHRGHPEVPVAGVQFHPESILTEFGHDLLQNFLKWESRR
jgi:anthranilate synthase/aminodeoxychorismate synthase-like glutamine amidotransferase